MKIISLLFFCLCISIHAQQDTKNKDISDILAVLNAQEAAWNNHDLEAFMQGYWKSEELKFYGSGGLVKGWQNTLDRYKKGYPTAAHFGKLRFVFNAISKITEGAYSVMGEYHLTREVGDTNGIFMLIVKKINGEWKVIADTSAKVN